MMDIPLAAPASPRSLGPASSRPPQKRSRFLSEAECHDIAQRLQRFAQGGGTTATHFVSAWQGFVRWGRNRITAAGEDRNNQLKVIRDLPDGRSSGRSNTNWVVWNEVDDVALVAAVRRAERLARTNRIREETDLYDRPDSPWHYTDEPTTVPALFSEATYDLDADRRVVAARQLMQQAQAAGMLSAGYIEVAAWSFAWLTSAGYTQYCAYTTARFSTTVRDPKGIGSGWAGVDWPDWSKVDGEKLAAIALDKCLKSRNPVAVEPGRYTTILEPQAVADFLSTWGFWNDRLNSEGNPADAWHKPGGRDEPPNIAAADVGYAKIGEKVIDERLTVSLDPLDPMMSFAPFMKQQDIPGNGYIYHPLTIIENGILRRLGYSHDWAVNMLGKNVGNPGKAGAFKISVSGPSQTIEEMIATTKRGLWVTRFENPFEINQAAHLVTGNTRDGVWLIENGKVSKPVKNLRFVESCYFVLNNVEQVGEPQRTFHPMYGGILSWQGNPQPIVVPALKVRDFSFTALTDSI